MLTVALGKSTFSKNMFLSGTQDSQNGELLLTLSALKDGAHIQIIVEVLKNTFMENC